MAPNIIQKIRSRLSSRSESIQQQVDESRPGPNEAALKALLSDMIKSRVIRDIHVTWGPKARRMSREDRAAALLALFGRPGELQKIVDATPNEVIDMTDFIGSRDLAAAR